MRFLSWNLSRHETVHNYAGVLVPLEEAHLHSYSARLGRTEFEERPGSADDLEYEAGTYESGSGLGADAADKDQDQDLDNESTGMLQMSAAEYTIEGLRREVRKGGGREGHSEYELKSKLINKAIQDIGMGSYNWQLFVMCGFGWFADNLWMQGVSLTLPSLSQEFDISEKTVRFTTSSLFVGLCVGSFFWGLGADVMGRRAAFNFTLLITSIFGTWASYAGSWGHVCALFACLGTGVGGSLPVDGAVFLEFLPDASSALLTLLSVWWPVGQLASSFLAYYFITGWPVEDGWRYFIRSIGVVTFAMFAIRFFFFRLFESPKFLLSQGRQAEAVAVVHGMAYRNGKKTWITEEILDAVADVDGAGGRRRPGSASAVVTPSPRLSSVWAVVKDNLTSVSLDRVRPLFVNRTLGITTLLIWSTWTTIGMGYPLFNAFLPQYLSHGNAPADDIPVEGGSSPGATSPAAYRNYAIMSVVGVPGSLLAAYAVDLDSPFLGRRGTLAISTLVSAVFLFLFVTLGTTPGTQLFFTCVESFCQNIMYGVLYAFTPEVFPAPARGVGSGVASLLNRLAGLLAPVIAATVPGDGTTAPVYLSAALILAAFVGVVLIPIETRGRQRL